MKQPYIYTLPEAFIEDKSVPMRWKLYALINGFWIAHKTAYASNAFFAEKLGCSTRHIQGCLEDLEKIGALSRQETTKGRILLPGGTNPAFVGGRTGSSITHEPRVRPISDSISDSINGAPRIEIISEDSEGRPKAKSDPLVEKAARYWHRKCLSEMGIEPSGGLAKAKHIILVARKSLSFQQIQQMMDDWFEEQSLEPYEMIQITRCLSSFQTDKFKAEKV